MTTKPPPPLPPSSNTHEPRAFLPTACSVNQGYYAPRPESWSRAIPYMAGNWPVSFSPQPGCVRADLIVTLKIFTCILDVEPNMNFLPPMDRAWVTTLTNYWRSQPSLEERVALFGVSFVHPESIAANLDRDFPSESYKPLLNRCRAMHTQCLGAWILRTG